MNVLDLFSGIGGFSLGLEAAGMNTVAFCEREPFCRDVLKKHWPTIPVHPDVRSFNGTELRGTVDLVCGGYPCQPFSVAGKQLGARDERHLWPEMLRIIRNVRPRWVLAENVGGHIKLGFDEVAASLETEHFTVWPFVIPACAVNTPHRRDRLWIIAHANRDRLQRGDGQLPPGQGRRFELPALLPPFSREAFLYDQLPASVLCGSHDGIPRRAHRLRALGNAVVPHIAALIGQAIIQYEKEKA